LKVDSGLRILEFFLKRLDGELFLHFELIPDHLPPRLKEAIKRFPPGSLQFEVGVQSLDTEVQQRISRKQDSGKSAANLRWLREQSHAHIHADLIIGLPGEGVAGFARGFDRLWAMGPHEIQVGILKRLRGAPISRHTQEYDLRFSPLPPYDILATDCIDFATMRRLARFARYWDLVANSGRFRATLPLLLDDSPFDNFMRLSDWLFAEVGQTDRIQLQRLFKLLHEGMLSVLTLEPESLNQALLADYERSPLKGSPGFLRQAAGAESVGRHTQQQARRRQERHNEQ
jgi:hypothetical protein